MATPVVYNGVSYSIPAYGDVGYAQGPGNLSSYLIALASGPQTTGGLFSLTAPLSFGPNFGIIAVNYTTTTANPATAGQIRLAKTDTIDWRNNANTLNLPLGINGTDQLTFNGVIISTAAAGGTVNAGVAGRLTLYPAAGNTVDDVYTQNAFGIDVLIATQAARSVALEYTIPNPGNAVATATFALLELAQTITAAKTFANQTLLLQEVGGTDVVTINVAALAAGRAYTIPDVLGSADFVMNAGAQSIAGVKTFTGGAGGITMSASTIAMGANKITGLAKGTVVTDGLAYGQSVVQVVGATTSGLGSSTNAAFVNSGLTVTITPKSASNNILVLVSTSCGEVTQTFPAFYTLARGGTNLGGSNGMALINTGNGGQTQVPLHLSFLDAPGVTSAVQYDLQFKSDGTHTIFYGNSNQLSTITAIEIGA